MLAYNGDYTAIDGFEQLADLDAVVLGLVSLSDAEVLALAEEDDRSLLMFSGPGFSGGNTTSLDAMTAWFDQRSEAEDIHLRLAAVKLEAAEQAAASSGALSAMFLVFGTFTIAAGVLLSLTIIMLLADVRRSEVATVRALGLRRSDARALFLLEGATLAFIASGLGSVLGLGLAWIISAGFSSIFSSVDATNFVFDWTADSFLAGWIWGTLLALLILWSSALYNAQLNIVRALRGARAVIKNGVPWGVFLLQIMALGLVGLCGLSLLLSGLSSPFAYGAYLLLGSGLILLFTPLLTWELLCSSTGAVPPIVGLATHPETPSVRSVCCSSSGRCFLPLLTRCAHRWKPTNWRSSCWVCSKCLQVSWSLPVWPRRPWVGWPSNGGC